MIIRKAMAKRVQPDRVTPAFLFTSHAVNGHTDIPEKSANQPFVTGSGPCVMRRPKPPMPATNVHTQAANHPKIRTGFRINDGSVVCSIRNYQPIEGQSLRSTQHHSKKRKSKTLKS